MSAFDVFIFIILLLLIVRCLKDCIKIILFIVGLNISKSGGGYLLTIQTAFGQRIQTLRKERGLSQEKFALSIDMDRTYYASV